MKERIEEEYELLASGSFQASDLDLEDDKLGRHRQLKARYDLGRTRSDSYYSSYLKGFGLIQTAATATRKAAKLNHLLWSDVGVFRTKPNPTVLNVEWARTTWGYGLPTKRQILMAFLLLGLALLAIPTVVLLLVLWYGGFPPSYTELWVTERALPQHQWESWRGAVSRETRSRDWQIKGNDSFGSAGRSQEERYLRFPDHLWGHGLNNVLQEALLYALIAHSSNRSYVFEDFTWSHIPLPYTLYDFSLRPTRIPMSAFLGGWLVGQRLTGDEVILAGIGDMTATRQSRDQSSVEQTKTRLERFSATTDFHVSSIDTAHVRENRDGLIQGPSEPRRSICAEYFHHVCPPSERVEISFPLTTQSRADGVDILHQWVNRLNQDDVRDERCVVIRELDGRVWDSDFFGSTRILSLFPLIRDSLVLREFRWSSLVRSAVERTTKAMFSSKTTTHTIPGLVAVHLRRGDYKRHCFRLAHWGAGYMGWNRLLDDTDGRMAFEDGLYAFMDAETVIPDGTQAEWEREMERRRDAYYLAHCLPTVEQVVERLHEVREQYESSFLEKEPRTLKEVYVLTNGWPSFVDQLRRALLMDGWDKVVASVDVERGWVPNDHGYDSAGGQSESLPLLLEEEGRTSPQMQTFEALGQSSASSRMGLGLNKEEKGVSVAIDMGIAERAEVFVGNGFSSLSANVVLLRLAKGLPKLSNWML